MTITELIEQLKNLHKAHGDVTVYIFDIEEGELPIESVYYDRSNVQGYIVIDSHS